jgi:hypothetical protein
VNLPAGIEELELAAEPPRHQLQPAQEVERDGVRTRERPHVADEQLGLTALEQPSNALAQRGDVGPGHRRAEHEDHHVW